MARLSALRAPRPDHSLASPVTHGMRPRAVSDLGPRTEAILQEVAYVLHLTRRVKNAVLDARVADASAN